MRLYIHQLVFDDVGSSFGAAREGGGLELLCGGLFD